MPIALSGKDPLGFAETGSGKTIAFTILMIQFNLKLEVKRQNENATQEAFPRLTSSLTLNWRLNARNGKCTREPFPRLSSSLTLNWSLNVFDQVFSSRVAFSIPTFKLQFNLKLELKRVRHLQGYLSQLPRLSSSLTLNWSLNVFDLPDGFLYFHV
ncbi:hypothetical protein Ahy_B01g054637 [Arachis hypogaea]|uniref:Uncharacterized protein n=1 Tax=Arachis hypogaea TaxID=3818 RepID=A0A445AU47_ARAHY|nr:hypothetical protein Ahy_B01g054637 [Arachis hypogaea]